MELLCEVKLLPCVRFCNRAGRVIDKPYPMSSAVNPLQPRRSPYPTRRWSHLQIIYDVDGIEDAAAEQPRGRTKEIGQWIHGRVAFNRAPGAATKASARDRFFLFANHETLKFSGSASRMSAIRCSCSHNQRGQRKHLL